MSETVQYLNREETADLTSQFSHHHLCLPFFIILLFFSIPFDLLFFYFYLVVITGIALVVSRQPTTLELSTAIDFQPTRRCPSETGTTGTRITGNGKAAQRSAPVSIGRPTPRRASLLVGARCLSSVSCSVCVSSVCDHHCCCCTKTDWSTTGSFSLGDTRPPERLSPSVCLSVCVFFFFLPFLLDSKGFPGNYSLDVDQTLFSSV